MEVHAYPNVQFNAPALPLMIGNVGSLNISSAWTLTNATGSGPSTSGRKNAAAIPLQANVAFDMFADMNATVSQMPAKQGVEIMVWVAAFGSYAKPEGYSNGIQDTVTLPQATL